MKKVAAISLLIMFFASMLLTSPAAAISPPGCVSVIIVFKEAVSAQDIDYLTSIGGAIKYTYTIIDGVAAELPAAAASKLKEMQKNAATSNDPAISRIKYIEDDMKMYALGSEGAPAGQSTVAAQAISAMTVPDGK